MSRQMLGMSETQLARRKIRAEETLLHLLLPRPIGVTIQALTLLLWQLVVCGPRRSIALTLLPSQLCLAFGGSSGDNFIANEARFAINAFVDVGHVSPRIVAIYVLPSHTFLTEDHAPFAVVEPAYTFQWFVLGASQIIRNIDT